MNAQITKNQIVTVTNSKGDTYEGRVITAGQFNAFMGQFIVVSLEAAIGPRMTKCFTVNGTCKPFGQSQPVAIIL